MVRRESKVAKISALGSSAEAEIFGDINCFNDTHTHTLILSGGLHQQTMPQCRPGLSRKWPLQRLPVHSDKLVIKAACDGSEAS